MAPRLHRFLGHIRFHFAPDNANLEDSSNGGKVMLSAIHHVQLAMPQGQEAQARDFYSGVLGLCEVAKPERLTKRGGCWFESGPVKVHLGVMPDFRPATKAHPAFLVEDLNALRARCEAAQLRCIDDQNLAGIARFYVFDPFGNRIELMQPL
ncbi:MAG: VOC family protein [Sulfitobacter sp.]